MNKYLNSKTNYFFHIFLVFIFIFNIFFVYFLDKIPNYCRSDECLYLKNVLKIARGTYQDPLRERLVTPMHSLFIGPIVLLDLGRRFVVYLNLITSCLTISVMYLTSKFYFSNKTSLLISIIYSFYYLKFPTDFSALTEPFATFLIIFNFFSIFKI